jgi:plastocyanin
MRMSVSLRRLATAIGVFALALILGLGITSHVQKVSAQDTATVEIADFTFSPGQITVTAGTTVTWVNNDSAPHTATGDGGEFDTGTINSGGSASITFNTAGTFTYHCEIHPNMTATIVVQAADDGGDDGDDGGGPELPNTGVGLTASGPLGGSGAAGLAGLASLTLAIAGLALRRRPV